MKVVSFHSEVEESVFYRNLAIKRIWSVYKSVLLDIALLVTVNSAFSWLPYFIADLIMITRFHLTPAEIAVYHIDTVRLF